MDALLIGEVARRSGVTPSAIRYYQTEGLLAEPGRSHGRWRSFPPDAVDRLRVIRMARELGFSLRDIRTLLTGFSAETAPPTRWQQLATRKLPEISTMIQRAGAMKRLLERGLRCECVSVLDCIMYDCNPPVAITRRSRQAAAQT